MVTGLILLTIPYAIWLVTNPKWHWFLALLYTAIALAILIPWARRSFKEDAEINADPVATADWKWPEHMLPEKFRTHFGLYLMRQGWRVTASHADARGWITFLLSKDRWSLAVLCIAPKHPVSPEALGALEQSYKDTRITHTILATEQPVKLPTGTAFKGKLTRLTLQDFTSLDEALGLTNMQV